MLMRGFTEIVQAEPSARLKAPFAPQGDTGIGQAFVVR